MNTHERCERCGLEFADDGDGYTATVCDNCLDAAAIQRAELAALDRSMKRAADSWQLARVLVRVVA